MAGQKVRNVKSRVVILTTLMFSVCSAWPADAFGTVGILGQNHEHQKITRLALAAEAFAPLTLNELAGSAWRFGAVGQPDAPWRGLVGFGAAHCDNGDSSAVPGYVHSRQDAQANLEACRQWIFTHISQAVDDAQGLTTSAASIRLHCQFNGKRKGSAKCLVLEDLGLAWHASQDFYAHSNWSDHQGNDPSPINNPPGLAVATPAAWLDPSQPDAPFPEGLITGCWNGVPEVLYCENLSDHPRIRHTNLNKDTGEIDLATGWIGKGTTRRGEVDDNFRTAVTNAIDDTRSKWQYFKTALSKAYGPTRASQMLCLIESDNASTCGSIS